MSVVTIQGATKRFGQTTALQEIELSIEEREFVSLIGPSGCGKSTLLRIIGELPSGIQEGLGGRILTFHQYYSLDPTQLWATNIVAAALGIAFFIVIVIAEKIVVRRAPEHVA